MNHLPLLRFSSWNNGMRCVYCYVFREIHLVIEWYHNTCCFERIWTNRGWQNICLFSTIIHLNNSIVFSKFCIWPYINIFLQWPVSWFDFISLIGMKPTVVQEGNNIDWWLDESLMINLIHSEQCAHSFLSVLLWFLAGPIHIYYGRILRDIVKVPVEQPWRKAWEFHMSEWELLI